MSKAAKIFFLTLLALALGAGNVLADACLECHESSVFKVKHKLLYDYFIVYETSVHGLAGLSCVDCHGGDATATGDKDAAHEGIKAKERAAYAAAACDSCHEHEAFAFNNSEHTMGRDGEKHAPTCVSCHGAMEMDVIFAGKVKKSCLNCHDDDGPEGVAGRAEIVLARVNTIMGFMDYVEAQDPDSASMGELRGGFDRLTAAWHRFDLEEAERESEALLGASRAAKAAIAD